MRDTFKIPGDKFQMILDRSIDQENIFGTVVSISRGSENWTGAAGNLSIQSQYFIASVTKLFVSTIVMKFRQKGLLDLDDPISQYFSPEIMKGLHVLKGKDHSDLITVRHLLSHTSGLPDYFLQERNGEVSLVRQLITGHDQKWTFEEAIEISKTMQPHFIPGQKGKAYYSDTNFQLLGKIIEHVSGNTFQQVLQDEILDPFDLGGTYLYNDIGDDKPAEIYYRNSHARIPMAMTSFWADGSMVSTAEESVAFLRAFFEGKLFPESYLVEMRDLNRIFFPFHYGIGMVRFKLPWIFSPFMPAPELWGHMGTTGAFAYHCPAKNAYIAGTINQVHNPGLPYKLIIKLLNKI